MFKPVQYGVLSCAKFTTGMSWRNKKRSHKNISDNKGPSIDPWSTPKKYLDPFIVTVIQANSLFSIFKVRE